MKNITLILLLLQVPLYFIGWYLLLLYPGELLLLCYKALLLPYPARNFWPELFLLILLSAFDVIRVFLGIKGNLTRRKLPIALSLIFLPVIFVGYLYFTLWQTYVFTIELIFLVIGFVGMGLQLVFSPIVLWTLHRNA